MKGADTYNDAAKDAWRGWKWNSIASEATNWRELPPSEKSRQLSSKTVLYLVGPDDHDRRRALARGFANHNVIAVDLVQERIDEVRSRGGFGIRGSLQQLLLNWPKDWPIDVVDADLCSGLVNDTFALMACLFASRAVHADTVVSVNLMRGRDQQSNEWREWLREDVSRDIKDDAALHEYVKCRSANWSELHSFLAKLLTKSHEHTSRFPRRPNEGILAWLKRNRVPLKKNSYRSKTSRQVFDSIVHRWGCRLIDTTDCEWQEIESVFKGAMSVKCKNDDGVRQRIAALRAVRTTRLREYTKSS